MRKLLPSRHIVATPRDSRRPRAILPHPPDHPGRALSAPAGRPTWWRACSPSACACTLGQPVIVENVTGGSGNIGVGKVVRAAPDGYTLSIGNNGSHVLNAALYTLNFDILKDFAPVALLTSNPQIVVTRKTLPANDLKELVAWLRANPDKATAGSAGAVAT